MDELFERQADGGFQTRDAERAALELLHLLRSRVRRMVGGDDFNRPAGKALGNSFHVEAGPQRRLHFVVAVEGQDVAVGQCEVVWADFGGHVQAARLGVANHLHRVPGRDVGHVVLGPGDFGEQNIARHHHVFTARGNAAQAHADALKSFVHVAAGGEVQVFAVVDDGKSKSLRRFHGTPHHARVHDGTAIVGNSHNTGLFHRAYGGEFFALAALGDGANREHRNGRQPSRAFDDVGRHDGRIVHGIRVRHATNAGESARRSGAATGLNRFGVFESGLAQMHVHVDKARGDDHPGGVKDLEASRVQIGANRDDAPVLHGHIGHRVMPARRIHHTAIFDAKTAHSGYAPITFSNTAIRTATPFSTWFKITDRCESATSLEISLPRLIGPGCITIVSGRVSARCSGRSP